MNFAREGLPLIGIAAAAAVAAYAAALVRRSWTLWLIAFLLTLVAVWVAYFVRDPERAGERGDRVVVSPADGRVVLITEVNEPTFVGGPARRVSIFMNVFNVHVNRYPVGGTVSYVKRSPGKFLNAAAENASLENEQNSVGIDAGGARILVRQIAGLIARRIITYSQPGQHVQQGARMGLIRFGSRVDVFVPPAAALRVKVGDVTEAGTTILADLPAP